MPAQHTTAPSSDASRPHWGVAIIMILIMLVAMVIAMRIEERIWFCQCGTIRGWISDVWTSHCSQHLLDPYSVTHVGHGLIFFWVFMGVRRWIWPRLTTPWMLVLSVLIASGWEVLENSPFIINRYREATMSLDYLGDSILNSAADVGCCIAGFFMARWLGFWKTALFFLACEVVLVLTIRDSLILSTFMLIVPVESIKTWQMANAPIAVP